MTASSRRIAVAADLLNGEGTLCARQALRFNSLDKMANIEKILHSAFGGEF